MKFDIDFQSNSSVSREILRLRAFQVGPDNETLHTNASGVYLARELSSDLAEDQALIEEKSMEGLWLTSQAVHRKFDACISDAAFDCYQRVSVVFVHSSKL